MNILITGANRGLGYQLTRKGLEKGNTVFAGVRLIESSQSLVELKNQYWDKLHILELDVTSEKSIETAYFFIKQVTEKLDVLINNAGMISGQNICFEDLDIDQMLQSFQVNTFGPMKIVQKMLPLINAGNNQVVINISSEAATLVSAGGLYPGYSYCMSKAALNMFSEKLKEYLGDRGIRVYSIHPGWMKTAMGGENAPTEPHETAIGIYKIIEGEIPVRSKISFIDFRGKPMPL
jgi:NAD(P)-dependent dehydrogenase (short-subunit alcohol dehydrogenase family)